MGRLMTITQCAEEHGVTRAAIHKAIKRGALPAERVGHGWVIREEACAGYEPVRDPRDKGRRAAAARWGARGK